MSSRPYFRSLLVLVSVAVGCACSSVQVPRVSPLASEAEFYSSIKPPNAQIVSSIRAIEGRREYVQIAQRMMETVAACDTWMAVRRERLQPWDYSFATLCFSKGGKVDVATFTASGADEVRGTIHGDENELLAALERPTIVADSGLGISDGSFSFITLFAGGRMYRHAIICDDCVEQGDQDKSFALIASSLQAVRKIVAEAKQD